MRLVYSSILLPNGVGESRQNIERITGTRTIFFIHKLQVPEGRKVTYANWVCNIRPQNSETRRVRMAAGGDCLDCPYDVSSPAVLMPNAKLHINSTTSDAHIGARYLASTSPTSLSTPTCPITNTCGPTPPKYRKKYETNTTSTFPPTVSSTSRSAKACTD